MFALDKASRALGMVLISEGPGSAVVEMSIRDDMVNGHGITHGGFVFALADTAFACACNESCAVTVAAGADINFLAPTRAGDRLRAEATLRSERGRSGIYDVTVMRIPDRSESPAEISDSTEPETVAEFRGRSRTLPPTSHR